MSVVAKVLLYPLVVPVVLCYELSRFAWGLLGWRPFLLGVVSYIFGPLFSVLGGLELSSYLGWERGLAWPIWLSAFFVFQLAFLGIIWPLLVTLAKPLLWVLNTLGQRAYKVISHIEYTVWRYSAKIGRMVPFWSFWNYEKNPNNYSIRYVASTWFSFLVLAFCVLSLAAHFVYTTMPIWTYINTRLGSMAPWLTLVSHFTLLFLIAISPLLVFGLFGSHVITNKLVAEIYGSASMLFVLDLLRWTNLLTEPPFTLPFSIIDMLQQHLGAPILSQGSIAANIIETTEKYLPFSPLSLLEFQGVRKFPEILMLSTALYLVTFIFVLPTLGMLSQRRLFSDIILVFISWCIIYHRWAMDFIIREPSFFPYLSLSTTPIIFYVVYSTGTFFALHQVIVWAHAVLITVLCYQVGEYAVFVGALDALITSQFVIHFTKYLWIYSSPFATLGVQLLSIPLLHAIIIPLLALPLWPLMKLTSLFSPASFNNFVAWTRRKVRDGVNDVMNRWERLISNSFDEHSSFETMFGWLMTATLVFLAVINYAAFFITSGSSPLAAMHLIGAFFLPDVKDMFAFQPMLNATTTAASVVANVTSSVAQNSTNFGEISQSAVAEVAGNLTNATVASVSGSLPYLPAILWYPAIDVFVFLAVSSNVLILCGKLASKNAAPTFSLVNWVFWFSQFRQMQILKCHYRIITEIIAAELALIVAMVVAPLFYIIVHYICRPFVPKLAPIICIPFERLWSLQQWIVRVWIRNYYNFLAFCAAVWDSVFGAPKPVRSQTPLYARPRRYG